MRRCRWCGAAIREFAIGGNRYWVTAPVHARPTSRSLVCDVHERATQSNVTGIRDNHDPEPYDLPPALDPASVSRWLDV